MRVIEFKMERHGLVEEGDEVTFFESELPTSYYYTIAPAVAMSKNFNYDERVASTKGKIQKIEQRETGYYILLEVEE